MIEITYIDGRIDTFEIYSESNTHIIWKDYALNLIRINKHTGKVTLFHDNEWINYDISVQSYRKI